MSHFEFKSQKVGNRRVSPMRILDEMANFLGGENASSLRTEKKRKRSSNPGEHQDENECPQVQHNPRRSSTIGLDRMSNQPAQKNRTPNSNQSKDYASFSPSQSDLILQQQVTNRIHSFKVI